MSLGDWVLGTGRTAGSASGNHNNIALESLEAEERATLLWIPVSCKYSTCYYLGRILPLSGSEWRTYRDRDAKNINVPHNLDFPPQIRNLVNLQYISQPQS